MKVIFVGMHNKVNVPPLHKSTKSGKLVDRVVEEVIKDSPMRWIKTNLYDVDYYPMRLTEKYELAWQWHERIDYAVGDVVVLLGHEVHKNFILNKASITILKFPHPSSQRSHVQMNEYVSKMSEAILSEILKKA